MHILFLLLKSVWVLLCAIAGYALIFLGAWTLLFLAMDWALNY
jgi:hypothetical protein